MWSAPKIIMEQTLFTVITNAYFKGLYYIKKPEIITAKIEHYNTKKETQAFYPLYRHYLQQCH